MNDSITEHVDSIEVELDKPRRLRFDIQAQRRLKKMTGLPFLQFGTALSMIDPELIAQGLVCGLRWEDPTLGADRAVETVFSLMEKARLRVVTVMVKNRDTRQLEPKTIKVNNAYLAGKIIEALQQCGALDNPEDVTAAEDGADAAADPSTATSTST